jgi:hypothetical protein
MNIGINGSPAFANDLIKNAMWYTSSGDGSYTGSRIICDTNVTVDPSDLSYRDASVAGMTGDMVPTTFPGTSDTLSLVVTGYLLQYFTGRLGTYDVTFTPGLEWTFNGGGFATRTAYNSAAGTATIVITDLGTSGTGAVISFNLTGYNGVNRALPAAANFYFRAFKQGTNTSKLVIQELKDALAPFAGGMIRMMGPFRTSRAATANVTYKTLTNYLTTNAVTWNAGFSIPPIEVLIEIANDTGMIPWVNIHDAMSDSVVTSMATRAKAMLNTSTVIPIEYGNEFWNFSVGFAASSGDLNSRAVAAGVPNYIQYARELKAKILLWQAVWTGADAARLRPVPCWQSSTSASQLAAMLDEGNLYQYVYGFGIGPYNGGGIGGYTIGDYNNTLSISKADRDLVLTDPAGFKNAAFAALTGPSLAATMTVWYSFVAMLRDYCAAKGLPRSALRPMTYECAAQHIIEQNTPTANNQQTLTRQAFVDMLRDPRMGSLTATYLELLADCGADLCFFALSATPDPAGMVFGNWGSMDTLSSTTQEPYVSVKNFLASPPQRPRATKALLRGGR